MLKFSFADLLFNLFQFFLLVIQRGFMLVKESSIPQLGPMLNGTLFNLGSCIQERAERLCGTKSNIYRFFPGEYVNSCLVKNTERKKISLYSSVKNLKQHFQPNNGEASCQQLIGVVMDIILRHRNSRLFTQN